MKEKLRVLIFDRTVSQPSNTPIARTYKRSLEIIQVDNNYNFDISVDTPEGLEGQIIPKDYDGYIVHPSNTTIEEVERLREMNPRAVIYIRSGHSLNQLNPRLRNCVDGNFELGFHSEFEEFLHRLDARRQA